MVVRTEIACFLHQSMLLLFPEIHTSEAESLKVEPPQQIRHVPMLYGDAVSATRTSCLAPADTTTKRSTKDSLVNFQTLSKLKFHIDEYTTQVWPGSMHDEYNDLLLAMDRNHGYSLALYYNRAAAAIEK